MGRSVREDAGRAGAGDRIEFLTPRDSIFGGNAPVDFSGIDVDDLPPPDDVAPRPRWLTGAATLAVVGLVGGGIMAAAPWSSGSTARKPSTPGISVPANSVPGGGMNSLNGVSGDVSRPVSTGGEADQSPPPVTGFVFDPLPAGFAVSDASSDTASNTATDTANDTATHADNDPTPPGWGEVWATDDASRSSGSWFSVTLLPAQYPEFGTAATRVDLGGRIGVVREQGDGVLQITIPLSHSNSRQTLLVRSFGRTFAGLVALAESIGVEQDHPQLVDDRPVYLDQSQLEGFELVASGATERDLLDAYLTGATSASTYYQTGNDDTFISIVASPRDASLEPLGRLAVGPVRIFPDSSSVSSDFTGDDLVLGVSPSGTNPNVLARWHTDDTTISISTTLPLGDLLALLPTVRRTTANEWLVVQRRVDDSQSSNSSSVQGGPGIIIGSGTSSSGGAWSATVQPPDGVQMRFFNMTQFIVGGDNMGDGHDITVTSFVGGTIAMALGPPGVQAGEVQAVLLRVMIGGEIVAEAPMTDIGQLDPTNSFARRAAALMFEQTGPFDAQLVAQDGSVLDHVASPGYVP